MSGRRVAVEPTSDFEWVAQGSFKVLKRGTMLSGPQPEDLTSGENHCALAGCRRSQGV